ncbi:hypothetical protein [Streptomyces hypolithicus]
MCTERGLDPHTTRTALTRQAARYDDRAERARSRGRSRKAARLRAAADRCRASAQPAADGSGSAGAAPGRRTEMT